jgi:hypothetical protein
MVVTQEINEILIYFYWTLYILKNLLPAEDMVATVMAHFDGIVDVQVQIKCIAQ